MLSFTFSNCYAERYYAECHYAGCHYAEFRYAECHYAGCRYVAFRCAEYPDVQVRQGDLFDFTIGHCKVLHSSRLRPHSQTF
jgi:hypothetical protein